MTWDRIQFALRSVDDLPAKDVVAELIDVVGVGITALIAGTRDRAEVKQWLQGVEPPHLPSLRSALQTVRILKADAGAAVAQRWLTGLNPELGGQNPLKLLRSDDAAQRDAVVRAALRFFS